jgi:hypothetical protein
MDKEVSADGKENWPLNHHTVYEYVKLCDIR